MKEDNYIKKVKCAIVMCLTVVIGLFVMLGIESFRKPFIVNSKEETKLGDFGCCYKLGNMWYFMENDDDCSEYGATIGNKSKDDCLAQNNLSCKERTSLEFIT